MQKYKETLTNNVVSYELLGPVCFHGYRNPLEGGSTEEKNLLQW